MSRIDDMRNDLTDFINEFDRRGCAEKEEKDHAARLNEWVLQAAQQRDWWRRFASDLLEHCEGPIQIQIGDELLMLTCKGDAWSIGSELMKKRTYRTVSPLVCFLAGKVRDARS